jgi:hypothetical protein
VGTVAETGQDTGRDLRLAARRFIVGVRPRVVAPVVWRVEEQAPAIYWILYTGAARPATPSPPAWSRRRGG